MHAGGGLLGNTLEIFDHLVPACRVALQFAFEIGEDDLFLFDVGLLVEDRGIVFRLITEVNQ